MTFRYCPRLHPTGGETPMGYQQAAICTFTFPSLNQRFYPKQASQKTFKETICVHFLETMPNSMHQTRMFPVHSSETMPLFPIQDHSAAVGTEPWRPVDLEPTARGVAERWRQPASVRWTVWLVVGLLRACCGLVVGLLWACCVQYD